MGQLDFLLGPMLVGTLISVFLSGIMIVQCYNYFVRFPRDPSWMKFIVAYLLVTDLAHAGVESVITYQYTVTFFGDLQSITSATSLFASVPLLSVSISTVAQCFFAWRVARLTRVKLLGWLIGALAFVQFLCGIGVTIAVTKVTSFFQFSKFQAVVIPWLTASVLCDLLITISLCHYLSSHRSGIPTTDDLVTRLIRATIQTGLVTSLWAILDLVIYRTEDNSMHLIFNFPLAKIYTNSLMSTLNARRSHAEVLRQPGAEAGIDIEGDGFSDAWGFKITPRSGASSTLGGYTHTTRTHDIPIRKISMQDNPTDEDVAPSTPSGTVTNKENDQHDDDQERRDEGVELQTMSTGSEKEKETETDKNSSLNLTLTLNL